jgi:hypothetical protein
MKYTQHLRIQRMGIKLKAVSDFFQRSFPKKVRLHEIEKRLPRLHLKSFRFGKSIRSRVAK